MVSEWFGILNPDESCIFWSIMYLTASCSATARCLHVISWVSMFDFSGEFLIRFACPSQMLTADFIICLGHANAPKKTVASQMAMPCRMHMYHTCSCMCVHARLRHLMLQHLPERIWPFSSPTDPPRRGRVSEMQKSRRHFQLKRWDLQGRQIPRINGVLVQARKEEIHVNYVNPHEILKARTKSPWNLKGFEGNKPPSLPQEAWFCARWRAPGLGCVDSGVKKGCFFFFWGGGWRCWTTWGLGVIILGLFDHIWLLFIIWSNLANLGSSDWVISWMGPRELGWRLSQYPVGWRVKMCKDNGTASIGGIGMYLVVHGITADSTGLLLSGFHYTLRWYI